jgi:hypothetical protein
MNAVMDAEAAYSTMTKQVLESERVRNSLKQILLGPGALYEALRQKRQVPLEQQHLPRYSRLDHDKTTSGGRLCFCCVADHNLAVVTLTNATVRERGRRRITRSL